MTDEVAIKLSNVSKKYILHRQKPTLYESLLGRGNREEIWALKDINLEIKRGESVGIIGTNGSGKTTLAKIITGVTLPTTGQLTINGRIASLIELEAGFHPELSGERNIRINGLILGMNTTELAEKHSEIIDFSEIRSFIDAPFYTYSRGMKLRLAFSVTIHSNPDILVIDEVFSSGDEGFRNKSLRAIKSLSGRGKTIILISHYLAGVEALSERVVWIDRGVIKDIGTGQRIIRDYVLEVKKVKAGHERKPAQSSKNT